MLELKNIDISLSQNNRKIVNGFNFTLNRGEKAVIIGEEGNGKSTLLKYIYDEHLVERYCDCSGKVIKKGTLAYLPQNMDAQNMKQSLRQFFSEFNLCCHSEMLTHLELSLPFLTSQQTLGTLSGGEKVKVQLAKILMTQPDILLLDEPTNDLDLDTLVWLERFLQNEKRTVLYVSHDETLIERTANVIVHMEQLAGKTKCRITVAHESYHEYLSSRRAAFEKQAQVAKKQRADHDKQMEKWRQIYNRVDHEQQSISRQNPSGARLLKKKMKTVLSQGRRFEREETNFLEFPEEESAVLIAFSDEIIIPKGKVVLDVTLAELCVGNRFLARDIQLFVSGNEHIGITGKNGAGKSTFLAFLWDRLKDRRDLTASYMPQNYAQLLNDSQTPIEVLTANASKDEITKARTYMGSMRFTHEEMTGKIGALSGGQKAKLLFLDMVLRNANVLVLDEPTRNFSPLSSPVVRHALKSYGGCIISVSHDRKYLEEVCDKIYQLTESGLHLQQKK